MSRILVVPVTKEFNVSRRISARGSTEVVASCHESVHPITTITGEQDVACAGH